MLAPRAARWDREASFPTDNYRDMHARGLLGICIPAAEGGRGAVMAWPPDGRGERVFAELFGLAGTGRCRPVPCPTAQRTAARP